MSELASSPSRTSSEPAISPSRTSSEPAISPSGTSSEPAISPSGTSGGGHLVSRNAAGGAARAAAAAAGLDAPPRLHTVLVTCMDARIDPAVVFGLRPGDVHVLRNAGGVVTDDVVRSIVVSQRKLGTREVVLVRHTRCGMATITDESFAGELMAATGQVPPWPVHAFADPVAGVRADMDRLRADPFVLPDTVIRGYVLDIRTFALSPC